MNEHEFEIVKDVAKKLVKKQYAGRLYEEGDLYAAGWEAVLEFHEKFPDKTEDALLRQVIRRRMIDHVRMLRKRAQNDITDAFYLSDLATIRNSGGRDDTIMYLDMPDTKQAEITLQQEQFEDLLKVLHPRERNMARWYVENDLNYREIGEIMGVSETRVCQWFNQLIFPAIRKAVSA